MHPHLPRPGPGPTRHQPVDDQARPFLITTGGGAPLPVAGIPPRPTIGVGLPTQFLGIIAARPGRCPGTN